MAITSERAGELFKAFGKQRILVVGDLMLDRYVYGHVDRISPEAPVPVVHVQDDRNTPGGACNVAANIIALGGSATICGVIGADAYGDDLQVLMTAQGLDLSPVVRLPGFKTTVKTRVVADRQQVCRVDRESANGPGDLDIPDVRSALARGLQGVTGVIIEDYGKGVIEQSVVRDVIEYAEEHQVPTGFDPKDNHDLNVEGVTVATPNRLEAVHAAGLTRNAEIEDVGRELMKLWKPRHLLLTLGPEGMMRFAADEDPVLVPTRAQEVFDVSGAGDTVIAVCLLSLAAGASFAEAAELSNYAAGVVVGKLGTATCSPGEILESMT